MFIFNFLKEYYFEMKRKMKDYSYESIIGFIDFGPKIAGFSIKREKSCVWFWLLHFSLLFYVSGIGIVVYHWKHAEGTGDYIKSYLNISIVILEFNLSWQCMTKRSLLKTAHNNVYRNDCMARDSIAVQKAYKNSLKLIKISIFLFCLLNLANGFILYYPARISLEKNAFARVICVGMEPLTASPNREICTFILVLQEVTITIVCIHYQTLQLFLIAHTTVMYQLLANEMMAFAEANTEADIKALARKTLPSIMERHALTLKEVDHLKSLYSAPLGINFGCLGVCMLLFCYLSLQEWRENMPILFYSFIVFFLYCFLCQRMTNASELFETSVYCGGWENFDLREKKLIYVMLRQAQKPVLLLAADIIPVNIYTFASTLQAIYKFVTVVKL